jgi:hypothetical protein
LTREYGAGVCVDVITLYRALPRLLRHAILAVVEQSYTRAAPVMRTQEGANSDMRSGRAAVTRSLARFL